MKHCSWYVETRGIHNYRCALAGDAKKKITLILMTFKEVL